MKFLNYKDIDVSSKDDFLYHRLMNLFSDVKITQGGSALDATLRRHPQLKNYAMKKQFEKIAHIEATFFNPDGSLDLEAIESLYSQLPKNLD